MRRNRFQSFFHNVRNLVSKPAAAHCDAATQTAPDSLHADDRLRSILKCPVCLEILLDPVTLACGHSFCLACTAKMWQFLNRKRNDRDDQLLCPCCRHRQTECVLPNQTLREVVRICLPLEETQHRLSLTEDDRRAMRTAVKQWRQCSLSTKQYYNSIQFFKRWIYRILREPLVWLMLWGFLNFALINTQLY